MASAIVGAVGILRALGRRPLDDAKGAPVRMRHTLAGLAAAASLVSASPALARQIQLTPVVSGLASPVFVANAGDGTNRLFILEQAGIIKVLQPGATTPSVFLDIRPKIVSGGEQGRPASSGWGPSARARAKRWTRRS